VQATIETFGVGRQAGHRMANGSISVEVLTGLDARALKLVDLASGRNMLSERRFGLAARSKLPYGITTWVKGGTERDGWSGVLSANVLGYEKVPVREPIIQQTEAGVRLATCQEGQGVRFEKEFFLPARGSVLHYRTRLTNLGNEPRRLQLEHFFVWNTDSDRAQTSFVVPTLGGADALWLPAYDDLDCRAVVPSEPWGAFLDHARAHAVVFTFRGIHKLHRYVAGPYGEFSGYSPEVVLAPYGVLENFFAFHVVCPLDFGSVPAEIEPVHRAVLSLAQRQRFTSSGQSAEDVLARLLPRPKQLVRSAGSLVLGPQVVLRAGGADAEAKLFAHQLEVEHGLKLGAGERAGPGIQLRLRPEGGSPQGYRLEVDPDGIVVSGSAQGIHYGLQTLLDLLYREGGALRAPCCAIEDEPDIALRGMLLLPAGKDWDLTVRRFAAGVMARLKLNALMLHFAPAAVRFDVPIEGVEPAEDAVAEGRLREMARLLKTVHIEIVPGYGGPRVLCPASQKAEARVASQLLGRLADIFGPRWVNVGYDEMGHFSAACPCCRSKPNHEVFVQAVSFLHGVLKEHGTVAAIWNDMLFRTEGDPLGWLDDRQWAVEHLPRDLVLNDYEYDPSTVEYSRLGRWKEAGFEQVTGSPWSTEENVLHYARSVRKFGCLGLLGTSWGEGPSPTGVGHAEGIVWTAAYGWRVGEPPIADAQAQVVRRAQWIASRAWERLPVDPAGCLR